MTDCPNAEIRDLLPEYLNGSLDSIRLAHVEAHIAGCQDCAEEVELLRLVREAWSEAPPLNVSAIVAALPRPSRRPATRSWRHSHAFQIAAAVSFIALGSMSLAVARSFFGGDPTANGIESVETVDVTPVISFAGGVSDLGDEELEALLSAIESMEALPVTEPAEVLLSGTGRQGS